MLLTAHLKMVKMVNFTLCIFYHDFKNTTCPVSQFLEAQLPPSCQTAEPANQGNHRLGGPGQEALVPMARCCLPRFKWEPPASSLLYSQ